MRDFQLAIIGFGTVGEGVYRTVQTKGAKLKALLGRAIHIPFVLVKNPRKKREVQASTVVTNRFEEILNYNKLDVVVEATPDAETAYPYVSQLLRKGVSVVSANKELIAKKGEELHRLAAESGCCLLYEGAVAGGIPLLNTLRHGLKTNTVQRLEGIVNGTSNYMLTKMREEGATFQDALIEAQEKGYAEAVPDKDVDGWDAYFKATILSRWLYGKKPSWDVEKPKGIRHVTVEDISLANRLKGRIKHVASLKKEREVVRASVEPCLVLEDHPLYGVEGVDNGIHIEGSIVGSVLLQGQGAGKYPTASAVVEDVVNVLLKTHESPSSSTTTFLDNENIDEGEEGIDGGLWFITGDKDVINLVSTLVANVLIVETGEKTGLMAYITTKKSG
ncbi:MAG: homoserine dehydrogenase [Bacillus sp. (in: Bacteria)]|nr:homoserine dehydrogenase [Bacillus sp. (in: firmicutes)]